VIARGIQSKENIVLCCCGCNVSKSQKQLSAWLQTKYCEVRNITPKDGFYISYDERYEPDLYILYRLTGLKITVF